MSKMSARQYDKSEWGPGPWQDEPDLVEFRHVGLPCVIRRHEEWGQFCGYVGIPPTHPDHGKKYDDVNVDVHGGLTFASECSEVACHVPAPGEPDAFFWFGFDCGHAFDLSPGLKALTHRAIGPDRVDLGEVYRDLAFARHETEWLAEQLAKRAG
jgi:hypothetical protein